MEIVEEELLDDKLFEHLLDALEECNSNPDPWPFLSLKMTKTTSYTYHGSKWKDIFNEFCNKTKRKKRLRDDWNLIDSNIISEIDERPILSETEEHLLQYLEVHPEISLISNFVTQCRVCLSLEFEESEELYEISMLDEDLTQTLHDITKVQRDDGFPQQICTECCKMLGIISSFREKCKVAHIELLRYALEENRKTVEIIEEEDQKVEIIETHDDESTMNDIVLLAQEDGGYIKEEGVIIEDDKTRIVTFKSEIDLDGERKHICSFCSKQFKTKLTLTVHIRTHTNERPYECEICGKTFKTCSAVRNHRASHDSEKPFACPHCPFKTTTKANLNIHDRTHTQNRAYECKHCSYKFTTSSNLSKHIKNVHEKLKTHACNHCDKRFFTKESARKHEITHTNIKPYTCPVCLMAYAWYNGLQKHMKSQHPGVKSDTEKMFFDKLVATEGVATIS